MMLDTACSGGLVALDVACRYIRSGSIDGAIIGASNLFLGPEHDHDTGFARLALSPQGRCFTFDARANGYCKSEAVNAVVVKRLDKALADRDPIRSVILGSATNSDGWTPGISKPNADAQVAAIRAAYAAAGITDFAGTGYFECHGTGTRVGDPTEVGAIASVFAPHRAAETPLIIGSIKSNLGHSEPAAGLNALLKASLAVENGAIPGNPTFETPNPESEFRWLSRLSRRFFPSLPLFFSCRTQACALSRVVLLGDR
jgi:acyl transferase domain-containing protein